MPSSRKEFHQVMKLPVDVATYCHGAVDRLHIRLLDENLLHLNHQHTEPSIITKFIQHSHAANRYKVPLQHGNQRRRPFLQLVPPNSQLSLFDNNR
jgi:hypothetical protein